MAHKAKISAIAYNSPQNRHDDPIHGAFVNAHRALSPAVAAAGPNADFARADLPTIFDLVIGNPPFSDRSVRCHVTSSGRCATRT
jgi:hypothetical protein